MACLIAPATAAVALTLIKKKISPNYHLEWLLTMLWGGVIMLIMDHILSGEIIMQPPFFTAGLDQIVWEVIQVGIPMTLVTIFVWVVMVVVGLKNKKIQQSIQ